MEILIQGKQTGVRSTIMKFLQSSCNHEQWIVGNGNGWPFKNGDTCF